MNGTLTKADPIGDTFTPKDPGNYVILIGLTNPKSAGGVLLEVQNWDGAWLTCTSLNQYNTVYLDNRLQYRLRAVACNGDINWSALVEAL